MLQLSLGPVRPVLLLALAVAGADATLSAQRQWFGKQPADAEVVKLRPPLLDAMLEAIAVPGEGPLHGLAARGGELLVARGDALIAFDVGTGKERRRGKVPRGLVALAADEHHFYALCGGAVLVLDAEKLELEREMTLPATTVGDAEPTGLAVRGDELLFVRRGRFGAIDARTGAAATIPEVMVKDGLSVRWLQGSAVTEELWGGDLRSVSKMHVGSPQGMPTSWPLPIDVRRVFGATVSGRLVLGVDHVDGEGRPQQLVGYLRACWLAWNEGLILKVMHDGRVVSYQIGPKPLQDSRGLERELQRIALEPGAQVPSPGGGKRLMPVMIEAGPGVRVRELLGAWDAAGNAGFEVLFAGAVGAAGQLLETPPEAPPPPPPPPPVRRPRK